MTDTAIYPAKVTFNADPEKRGAIRVACVGIMGEEDTEIPIDVYPVHDWGWFYVPDVGEIVDIEVCEGSEEDEQFGQMSIDNLDMKWRSGRYYGNTEGDTPTPIHETFTSKNYGKRRGFATPAGHVFMFDDTEGQEEITLSWKDGSAFIRIDSKGSVLLSATNGATLTIEADTGKIIATSGKIEINGAEQAAILGNLFKQYFDMHTHPTGTGPSGPPIVPMPDSTLSTITTVG